MKTYYFSTELKLNWIQALVMCRSYDMSLVSFNTAVDYIEFKELYMENVDLFEEHTHIGGSKINRNDWYWVNSGSQVTTMKFAKGEPNGAFIGENCLNMLQEGNKLVLNDLPCSNVALKFVCESSEYV